MKFFNGLDNEMIFFKLNSANILVPMFDIPEESNIKIAYMLKKNKAIVTIDNYESLIVCRIISQNIQEGFKAITEAVSNKSHVL